MDNYVLNEDKRKEIISKSILPYIKEKGKQEIIERRALAITKDWEGRDNRALEILCLAAGKGRFESYATVLERYYTETLTHLEPEKRENLLEGRALEISGWLLGCYTELGAKIGEIIPLEEGQK